MIGIGIGTLLAGLAAGGGTVASARSANHASNRATQAQLEATNRAAQLQREAAAQEAKAAADALAFQQQQAKQDQGNFETTQRANYDQWAARQGQLRPFTALGLGAAQNLGNLLGVTPADLPAMPAYVPSGGGGGAAGPVQDTSAEQAAFQALVQGKPANPATLSALEPDLAAKGMKVLRNAAGIAGKVQLANGAIADVGEAFSSGDPSRMKWSWQVGGGPSTSASAGGMRPSGPPQLYPTAAAPMPFAPTNFGQMLS